MCCTARLRAYTMDGTVAASLCSGLNPPAVAARPQLLGMGILFALTICVLRSNVIAPPSPA